MVRHLTPIAYLVLFLQGHRSVNEWNTHKRFVRCYWKPDGALWAEQDARVRRGTTENVEEFLALWKSSLADFKKFMGI